LYQFKTLSGATYEVENGRISRHGTPIDGLRAEIDHEPFRFHRAPMVGEQFAYYLKDERFGANERPIVTATVTEIQQFTQYGRPSVRFVPRPGTTAVLEENYCAKHDLFDCWVCG